MKRFILLSFIISTAAQAQVWWTSQDSGNIYSKNTGSVLVGSFTPLGKLTVGPDDRFYNLSLVGDYNNMAKNYLQIGVTGRGFGNLQGQTIFDLAHSNSQARLAGYNFRIGGTSRLFINGDGYVGIGNEKPEALLDLSGGPEWSGFRKAIRLPEHHAIRFDAQNIQYGLVSYDGELGFVYSNGQGGPFGGAFGRVMTLRPRKVIFDGDVEIRGKLIHVGQASNGIGGETDPVGNAGGGKGGELESIAPPGTVDELDWVQHSNGSDIYFNFNAFSNVGIGTNSPGARLDLKLGTDADFFRIQRKSATGRAQMVLATEAAAEQWRIGMTGSGNTDFSFFDGSQSPLVLQRSGHVYFMPTSNVGIGTSTPAYKLDVAGTINAQQLLVNGVPVSGGGGGGSQWTTTGSNIYYSAGKVAVGTTNPAYSLHVADAADRQAYFVNSGNSSLGGIQVSAGVALQAPNSSGGAYRRMVLAAGAYYDFTNNRYQLTNATYDRAAMEFMNGGHISFKSESANRSTPGYMTQAEWDAIERMRISNNGNVGIGNPSPLAKLTIGVATGTAQSTTGVVLGTDQRNLEFVHSTYGSGYGSKIYNVDEGNGVTSLRIGTRSGVAAWTDRLYISTQSGNVGIGTTDPDTDKLAVNGTIRAKELYLTTSGWSDFVFAPGYKLRTLKQVEEFILKNRHLPEVPSEKEVVAGGVGVVAMQARLLQKIEELTLYMIDQQKQIESLRAEVESARGRK